jgi:hypothetical protein
MGGAVHGGRNDLGKHAGFGVLMHALNFDIGKARPQGALIAKRLTKIYEFYFVHNLLIFLF